VPRGGLGGAGLAHHPPDLRDGLGALPHHREDGAGPEEVLETVKEWLVDVLGVVLAREVVVDPHELPGDQLQAALFEPGDDLHHEAELDAGEIDVGFAGE
jgi:hypothetical protein